MTSALGSQKNILIGDDAFQQLLNRRISIRIWPVIISSRVLFLSLLHVVKQLRQMKYMHADINTNTFGRGKAYNLLTCARIMHG